ncbi:hypothetical protein BU16DRAFT_567563 [Lophium mytilinum]|uniref:Uncharacterized protein n=1 Tax=Lophium mytilinum TaxID=390894 RepID=A0A6A6QBE5_9PEZI|nr:hypothetical protein BU16DRAFT_567563 [Lophium mytilinum]
MQSRLSDVVGDRYSEIADIPRTRSLDLKRSQPWSNGSFSCVAHSSPVNAQHNSVAFFPPGWELAKKKYSYIWQCCACGWTGINITAATCPSCGTARCAYCQTTKVQAR